MGEFFKPWRRKAGVTTLVLASALCSAWLRSLSHEDRIDGLILAKLLHGYVVSANGQINIIRRFPIPLDTAINALNLKKWVSWRSRQLDTMNTVLLGRYPQVYHASPPDYWTEFTVNWRFDYANIHLGEGRHSTWVAWTVQLWSIPYSILLIPMTVLSAVLLIWTSRRKPALENQPKTPPN